MPECVTRLNILKFGGSSPGVIYVKIFLCKFRMAEMAGIHLEFMNTVFHCFEIKSLLQLDKLKFNMRERERE